MAKPLLIYLVRHGESAANLNKALNMSLADHTIPLSDAGQRQAVAAGEFLRGQLLLDSNRMDRTPNVAMYVSPYLRTRQTAEGLLHSLQDMVSSCHESIHLREQEFGLFDGVPDEDLPLEYPREHAHYQKHVDQGGKFYARMPMGESRCDVAQRVHQFFGTLHRDHDRHGVDIAVIVSHGVTTRCFTMMWANHPVEWMEAEPNPGNCSIRKLSNAKDFGLVFAGFKPPKGDKPEAAQARREDGVIGDENEPSLELRPRL